MQHQLKRRLIPLAVMTVWAGAASASGFQLLEQNASGLGNAYAGSAAVAENASTVFFNPAGMSQLEGTQISAGLTAVQTSYKFSNGASSVGALATAGDGNDGGGMGFIPNAYITKAISKDLSVGLGIGAPFGLKTEYDSPWMGAAQSVMFEVKTLNLNPSVAYRVNDAVSVGFGLNWQKINAEYKRIAGTGLIPTGLPSPPYPAAINVSTITSVMTLNDDAWGWNAGVLFNVSPTTKIGVSYRSSVKYKATGTVSLSSNGTAAGATALAILTAGGRASDVSADIELPDTLILSASHKLNDKWEMLGDLSWTGWSSIPKIDIMRTSGALNGQIAQTLDTNFRDTWRVAFGANYKYTDTLKLKFGIAHDQTPVKGADTRLTSLPDNDRTWLSFGVQWLPSKSSAVDVGVTRLFVKDAAINNNQTAAARGLVNGTYSDSAWLVGAQYSMAF
jgi:long-chain fatty acid transport protein